MSVVVTTDAPAPVLVHLITALVNQSGLGNKLKISIQRDQEENHQTLTMTCKALGDLGSLVESARDFRITSRPIHRRIKGKYVMLPRIEAIRCMSILRERNPDVILEDFAVSNPLASGATRYNPLLMEKVTLTSHNSSNVMWRDIEVFTEEIEDPTPVHEITVRMLTDDVALNIMELTHFLMTLSKLGLIPIA